jgi:hypothetical protein
LLLPVVVSIKHGLAVDPYLSVCRFALSGGGCKRADCGFSHDVGHVVCQFWLKETCLYGSDCRFRHSLDSFASQQSLATVAEMLGNGSDSTPFSPLDFPGLPSAPVASTHTGSAESGSFPDSATESVASYAAVASLPPSAEAVAKAAATAAAVASERFEVVAAQERMRAAAAAAEAASAANEGRRDNGSQATETVVASVEWVATGSDVSDLYLEMRAEAEAAARLRNRFFQAALEAYRYATTGIPRLEHHICHFLGGETVPTLAHSHSRDVSNSSAWSSYTKKRRSLSFR